MLGSDAVESPAVPPPGVISSYRNTWRQLLKYFIILLLFLLVIEAIPILFSYVFSWHLEEDWQLLVAGFALNFLVTVPLAFGFAFITVRAVRKEKVGIKNLLTPFRYYHNMVLAAVIYTAIIYIPLYIFSLVAEFVPILAFFILIPLVIFMIIIYCKLVFIPFVVTDKGLNAFTAIKTSWNMTDGQAGKVFLIILLGVPFLAAGNILLQLDIFTAGIICLVVGTIISIWMYLALALLYHILDVGHWSASMQPGEPSDYRMPGYHTGSRDRKTYPPGDFRQY